MPDVIKITETLKRLSANRQRLDADWCTQCVIFTARRHASAVCAVGHVSVRRPFLSVTSRSAMKKVEHEIAQTKLHNSTRTFFSDAKRLGEIPMGSPPNGGAKHGKSPPGTGWPETNLRKEKQRKSIYIAPFIYYVYLKALRHGSHSFTCKYTMLAFPS